MSGRWALSRASFVALLGVLLSVPATGAEQTASYVVRGLGATAVGGVGAQTGTEAVAFAFSEAVPEKGDAPKVGPRLIILITWSEPIGGAWVRRQWYGDVPLEPEKLAIALDLTEGKLDTEVVGTLEEYHLDGSILRKRVKGHVQIQWTGAGDLASTATAFAYQSSGYAAALQTVGTARQAMTSGSATVEGFPAPVTFTGRGTLASVNEGLLSVKTP